MSSRNLLRFYYNEFQQTERIFQEGNLDLAADSCCQLINAYECSRLIQVQAHQLRSLCTTDYWLAKNRLQSAIDLIASLHDDEDELVAKAKTHTEFMLGELEEIWRKHWEDQGIVPPKSQTERVGRVKRNGSDKSFHSASEGISPGTSSGSSSIEMVVEQAGLDLAVLDLNSSLAQLERLPQSAHFGAGRFATPETVSGEMEAVAVAEEGERAASPMEGVELQPEEVSIPMSPPATTERTSVKRLELQDMDMGGGLEENEDEEL
ncbi:hypothetical protein LTR17_002297 [Elasticomyces elasticus]|nr:hypothetical protein LTR17_002297 [Elasticomyces elasticus]